MIVGISKILVTNSSIWSRSHLGSPTFPFSCFLSRWFFFFVTKKLLRPKWRDPETHVAKLEPYVLQLSELELG
jgi:hypothetical protein